MNKKLLTLMITKYMAKLSEDNLVEVASELPPKVFNKLFTALCIVEGRLKEVEFDIKDYIDNYKPEFDSTYSMLDMAAVLDRLADIRESVDYDEKMEYTYLIKWYEDSLRGDVNYGS